MVAVSANQLLIMVALFKMKLKYYIKDNKKVYTLKDFVDGKPTKDAHYKFVRITNSVEKEN